MAGRMILTILESPYAGDTPTHIAYAKRCLLDSLARGEAPLASHLLYTQVLDDTKPKDRQMGIAAGHAWIACAHLMATYGDYGISKGMLQAIHMAMAHKVIVETRFIGRNP